MVALGHRLPWLRLTLLAVTLSLSSAASLDTGDNSIATRVRRGHHGHHDNQYTDKGGAIEVSTYGMDEITTASPALDSDEEEDFLDVENSNETADFVDKPLNVSKLITNIFDFDDLYNFTVFTNYTLKDIYNLTSEFDPTVDVVHILNVSKSLGVENLHQLENITNQLNISNFQDFFDFVSENNITNVQQIWHASQNTTQAEIAGPKLVTNATTTDVGLTSTNGTVSTTDAASSTTDVPTSTTVVTTDASTSPSTTDEPSRMETVTNDDSWTLSTTPLSPSTSLAPDDETVVYNRTEAGSEWVDSPQFGGLVTALVLGCLFVVILFVLFTKRICEMYKRRDYQKMDYLINGIYN